MELEEVVGTEILLIELRFLIGRELVTWQEDVGDVLAKRALESFEIETDDLSEFSFPPI